MSVEEDPVAITVLARAPVVGGVKTRLAASVGARDACRLHEAFVLDVLDGVAAWRRRSGAPAWLATTGDRVARERLHAPARRLGFRIEDQPPGDLGERIEVAVGRRLEEGARAALVLGSDWLGASVTALDRFFAALEDADVLLARATDGGFVALGARRLPPGTLRGIEWGGAETLEQTREACRRASLRCRIVEGGRDVDDVDALRALAAWLSRQPADVGVHARRAIGALPPALDISKSRS